MKKPLAVIPICNTMTLNIYDIIYGVDDMVLLGYSEEDAVVLVIEYREEDTGFTFNEEWYSVNEFMSVA